MVMELVNDQVKTPDQEEVEIARMYDALAIRDTARLEVPLKGPLAVSEAAMALRSLSHQLDQLAQRAQYQGQKPWITALEMKSLVQQTSVELQSTHKMQKKKQVET